SSMLVSIHTFMSIQMEFNLHIRCVLTLMILLVSQLVFAQTRTLTGKVLDEAGAPLVGATVKVKGTTLATTTDNDGVFTLEVADNAQTLEVSFIGYTMKEAPIVGTDITVQLRSEEHTSELQSREKLVCRL